MRENENNGMVKCTLEIDQKALNLVLFDLKTKQLVIEPYGPANEVITFIATELEKGTEVIRVR